jgi:hypothetical protein
MKEIDTRLVYGFLDAGKTTHIQENIRDDRYYKRGTTLIIYFEQGVEKYDREALVEKRADVVYYRRGNSGNEEGDITRFCLESIEKHQPDRIYVEMNSMIQGLRGVFPDCMRVTFAESLIDWATMPVYYANFLQMIKQMVSESNQVTFRGCPSSDLLEPYGQSFRLMNPKASYLRRDPLGYHEKAFGLFLPFRLEESEITITDRTYLPLWLDALDHPEHYEGKIIHFADPVELRRTDENNIWTCGRVVMTCCMADLQFMSFGLEAAEPAGAGWAVLDASARVSRDSYGQRKLILAPHKLTKADPPEDLILDGRRSADTGMEV